LEFACKSVRVKGFPPTEPSYIRFYPSLFVVLCGLSFFSVLLTRLLRVGSAEIDNLICHETYLLSALFSAEIGS
jgi:hypothetical protein